MPFLPTRFAGIILAFAPLFVHRSWRHARLLLIGAILVPGQRTVTNVLRVTGHARDRHFVNVHRVLSRAAWCPRTGSRILLGLLIAAFAPRGPVIMALDDTIERRRGKRITAKGIYRDPVRSSDAQLRQGERAALDEPDAARSHPMGGAHRGPAVPPRSRPLRARLPREGPTAQAAARCGTPTRPASPPPAARARPCAGRRQRLLHAPVPRRHAPRQDHGDHPSAARRSALRPRS